MERSRASGFALVVVLSLLVTITLLFAVSSSRTVSTMGNLSTDRQIGEREHLHRQLLAIATEFTPEEIRGDAEAVEVYLNQQGHRLQFVDVKGLLDINTTRVDVLEQALVGFGATERSLSVIRSRRQDKERYNSIGEFRADLTVSNANWDIIEPNLTVHSGLTEPDVQLASDELLEMLVPRSLGLGADQEKEIQVGNYSIRMESEDGIDFGLGVVHLTGNHLTSRIVAVD